MSILYLLIPLSLILLALAVWAFFWAVDNKQFDDLEGPAYSILFDDDDPRHTGQTSTKSDASSSASTPQSSVHNSDSSQSPTNSSPSQRSSHD